jgi:hypothetical protein
MAILGPVVGGLLAAWVGLFLFATAKQVKPSRGRQKSSPLAKAKRDAVAEAVAWLAVGARRNRR